MKYFNKSHSFFGATFFTLIFAVYAPTSLAAGSCDNYTPDVNGTTVACNPVGTTSAGVISSQNSTTTGNNVTVNINPGTSITVNGSTVGLGSGANVTNNGTLNTSSFYYGYGISSGVNGRSQAGGSTITNNGSIVTNGINASGITISATNASSAANTITNTGTISTGGRGANGIEVENGGAITAINNSGTIAAAGVTSNGIQVKGAANITNSGIICPSGILAGSCNPASTGTGNGIQIDNNTNSNRTTITNTSTGLIGAPTSSYYAIYSAQQPGVDVYNYGRILAASASETAINFSGLISGGSNNTVTLYGGSILLGGISFNKGNTQETLNFNGFSSANFNNALTGLNVINATNSSNVVLNNASGYELVAGRINVDGTSTLQVGSVIQDQTSPSGVATSITKSGAGTLSLSAANTYTGGTNLNAGTIAVGNNAALGTGALAITNGTILQADSSVTLANATSLTGASTINTNGNNLGVSGVISGAGSFTKSGAGTLTLSAANTYSGGTTVSAGTLAGTAMSIQGNITNNATVGFNQGVAGVYTGAMSGTGELVKTGVGTLTLSGANTYSGTTDIQNGIIAAGAVNRLSAASAVTIATGAGLDVTNLTQTIASLAGSGATTLGNATLTTGGNNTSTTYSGVISGVGGAITKVGTGVFTLSGANTYSGGTNLNAGTIAVGNNAALGAGGLAMATGTTLQAASSVSLANAVSTTGTTTVDTNSNSLGLSGIISGSGTLTKVGAGALTLSGANTYSGDTNLNAGGIILTGSIGSIGSIANTTVAAGATLQGGGVINGNVSNAGNIEPSFSGAPTQLTINGNYVGNNGSFTTNIWGPNTSPTADTLKISGGASGSTGITVVDKGGLGNRTLGDGIQVVQVNGVSGSTSNAFALNQRVASGAFEYQLVKGPATGSGNSWYLRTDNPADPVSVTVPTPVAPITPLVGERIEVSVYPALPSLIQMYAQTAVDTLDQRRGDLNLVDPNSFNQKKSNDWARIIGKTGSSTPSNINDGPKLNFNAYALQFGVDLYQNEELGGSRTYVGPYVTIGGANGNTSNQAGTTSTGNLNGMQAYSLGLYGTHFAENGLYVDALAQGSRYLNANASSVQGAGLKTQGSGFTGSLEAGGRWNVTKQFLISPQAQVVYDAIGMNNATDAYGQINFSKSEIGRGRLGVLAGHKDIVGSTPIFAYLRANYWTVFNAGTSTTFQSLYGVNPIAFQSQTGSRWLALDAEVNARLTKSANLFLNLGWENSLVGTYQAISGRIGLQTSF